MRAACNNQMTMMLYSHIEISPWLRPATWANSPWTTAFISRINRVINQLVQLVPTGVARHSAFYTSRLSDTAPHPYAPCNPKIGSLDFIDLRGRGTRGRLPKGVREKTTTPSTRQYTAGWLQTCNAKHPRNWQIILIKRHSRICE